MKNINWVALLVVLLFSSVLFAKIPVTKITITANGKPAVEMTDPKIVSFFNVWSGPGTSINGEPSTEKESFIIDWAHRCAAPPANLQRYRVLFYANNGLLIYAVDYVVDGSSRRGYVYLPGKSDDAYRVNTRAILRGVEGNWFRASTAWDKVAIPPIVSAAQ